VRSKVETPTQAKPSIEGRKITKEVYRLVQDARENVRVPLNLLMQRRSHEMYTSYMALMAEVVEIEPSSFKEAIKQPVWVNVIFKEYESIVKNSVWEVVPRMADKSVVGLRWIFKVNHVVDGRI